MISYVLERDASIFECPTEILSRIVVRLVDGVSVRAEPIANHTPPLGSSSIWRWRDPAAPLGSLRSLNFDSGSSGSLHSLTIQPYGWGWGWHRVRIQHDEAVSFRLRDGLDPDKGR